MKKILKALGKTIGLLSIGIVGGLTPVVLDRLFGPVVTITIVGGVLIISLFTLIYKLEK
jgi:hypothetical protein